jgi:VWFA-related protein
MTDYPIADRKHGHMSRLIAVTFLTCAVMVPLAALQDQPGSPNRPLGTGVAAVVVDVVVRDGRGHPVTNLRKEDFEQFEDGVQQSIGDVTAVGTPDRREPGDIAVGSPAWAGLSRTGTTGGGAATPSFLAIVFDRLSPEARALAYEGALACVATVQTTDFVGIFLSDLSLTTIQPYTNDREKLRAAIKDVASRATAVFDRVAMRDFEHDEKGNPLPGDAHPSVDVVASAEFEGRPVDTRSNLPQNQLSTCVSPLCADGLVLAAAVSSAEARK